MLIPVKIPLMILSSATLFPDVILPLHIFNFATGGCCPTYSNLTGCLPSPCVGQARAGRFPWWWPALALRGFVWARARHIEPSAPWLEEDSCVGAARYKPYRVERVEPLDSTAEEAPEVSGLRDRLLTMVKDRLGQVMGTELPSALLGMMLQSPLGSSDNALSEMTPKYGMDILEKLDSAHKLADFVASTLLRDPHARQVVLESLDIKTRLVNVCRFLSMETEPNTQGPQGHP